MTNETQTLTIQVPVNMIFGTKVSGESLPIDLFAASNSFLLRFLAVGTQRHTNDKFSGEKGQDKLDAARLEVEAINKGEEWEGRSRGGSASIPPVLGLALKNAKAALTLRFKAVTKLGKAADWCAASPKIDEYFGEDRKTWVQATVVAWMETQKTRFGVDYMGEAERDLAALADETVDVSDLY